MPPQASGKNGGPAGRDEPERGPKVMAPPPLIFVLCLGLGLGLEWLWPLPPGRFPAWLRLAPAIILAAPSGLIALAAFIHFKRHQTPVDPAKPTTGIITSGPFRFSRNPMYLSLVMLFAAVFCLVPSWWLLLFGALYLAVMDRGVIIPEEKYLTEKFGQEYQNYMAKTRRWL